ncbi:hypothetical protein [Desulfotruncus alcoholivorax]|uniref:hypothetical protein n=1 Tax=Desulfotruncus alcoholivorax TaxID=265477 RepID=UPI0004814404|nr:hypothetical protein [Desulfotruncus alcoholivorax]
MKDKSQLQTDIPQFNITLGGNKRNSYNTVVTALGATKKMPAVIIFKTEVEVGAIRAAIIRYRAGVMHN